MKKILSAVITASFLLNPVCCLAGENVVENENPVKVSATEVGMDKETGEFSFDVTVDTEEAFAGMEFGLICSKDCEITDVAYNVKGQNTAPTKAEGVTWFGFFEGEDIYTEDIVATISGTCDTEKEAAIALQVVKRYTVGEEEYTEEQIPVDVVVNITASTNPLLNLMEIDEETVGMNVGVIIAVCVAAVALIIMVSAFTYKKLIKSKKGNEETKE